MQAIILAAGMGKRLKELTSNATKCMVEVNGVTLIERMLVTLDKLGLTRIVLVIGYEGQKLMDYVNSFQWNTPLTFIQNDIYYKTNNIYSLFLAKDYLLEQDTILLESDLIFEDRVVERLIEDPYPSLALVVKYESWMDGTVVTLDENNTILDFINKNNFKFEDTKQYYKTVNLYKFSKAFSASHYIPFLEAYCKALGNNEYYEQVLKVITLLDKPEIKACCLKDEVWYEIDDIQDLNIAESLFANGQDKLQKMTKRYGGYWRYPHMIDFCYLVNPFFPSPKLIDEIKANFERLLCEYPSGMEVNSLLAAKYFGLKKEQICVGNGAAELIKCLMEILNGKIGIIFPTFQEYPNRKKTEDIVAYIPENRDFSYTAEDLIEFYHDKDIQMLTLINPDNPSGNYISKEEVIKLAVWTQDRKIRLILDESFVDFADTVNEPSLLEDEWLLKYPTMVIIKSISKSYGVPGLRLGVLACGDSELITAIKKEVAIWNINSFGEFYMQIFEKYKDSYKEALQRFKSARLEYISWLKEIPNLRVIPSQANYIMCELLEDRYTSNQLTELLLDKNNLLIKDLSNKKGFEKGQYIRVAIKRPNENKILADALKKLLS